MLDPYQHLLDPYQQYQHGIECFPQIREMMVALESEVQEYGGCENISCIQMDGKNTVAEFKDVQRAIGPISKFVSEAKSVKCKHETFMLLTIVSSTVKLLYRQTKMAQSERSNRVPEGRKKSHRDWSTSLNKQARAPGTDIAELS